MLGPTIRLPYLKNGAETNVGEIEIDVVNKLCSF